MRNKLNMRKKAQEFYGYEIDFEKMFPTFEKEQAIDTVTRWLQGEFSSDQIQDLIVENKLYDYIYYTFIGMYSHLVHKDELSKNVLKQLAREMTHKWEVEGSPLSIPTDIKELTKIDPVLQKLLNKYTEDEIFDIASGRKEATEEEVEQAKEVITRGIISNRLSMRKKAGDKVTSNDLKRFYDLERKGLLTDEFTDDVLSKLLYGLQDYAKELPDAAAYAGVYIKDLEKASTLSLNKKIIAIDQVINEFHEDMMPELMEESEDPDTVYKVLNELFHGYQVILDHARHEIERLKLEGETPTVENIRQHLEDYWSTDEKITIKVLKELLESGEIVQEKEASILSMRKFSQSSPETIQKAQAGDEDAIAQVIEENIGLISQALINWGYTPKSDEFEDVMSDIKVEMLNRIIPQYDSSKGAFSTFLSTAVYNFLRRGTREKEYKEKQKEVSLAEPIEEGITIEDTLADPTSEVVQMTLSSARENLQNWLYTKKPELEEVVLRMFDLKVEEYSHEQIAEALNEEGYTSKGKAFTRTMVNNYVNDWIKPALVQFFEAFKTAKLNMRKKAEEEQPLETPEELEKLLKGKRFKVIDLNEVAMGDFGIEDEEEYNKLLRHNNEYALVTGIAVAGTDMEDTYVDVTFDDGYEIEGLSTYHLTHLSFDEPDEADEKKLTEETMEASPYAELLRKYSPDEIFDIAAGRKTDITAEEVEQAKEVITRGIVSSRLSMRKIASVLFTHETPIINVKSILRTGLEEPFGYAGHKDVAEFVNKDVAALIHITIPTEFEEFLVPGIVESDPDEKHFAADIPPEWIDRVIEAKTGAVLYEKGNGILVKSWGKLNMRKKVADVNLLVVANALEDLEVSKINTENDVNIRRFLAYKEYDRDIIEYVVTKVFGEEEKEER